MAENSKPEVSAVVIVTPEMIRAGIDELREHSIGDDWNYVLECVYRVMFYESVAASSIRDSR